MLNLAYFAVDRKNEENSWKFRGFITAKNFQEAREKLQDVSDQYRLTEGYAITK